MRRGIDAGARGGVSFMAARIKGRNPPHYPPAWGVYLAWGTKYGGKKEDRIISLVRMISRAEGII